MSATTETPAKIKALGKGIESNSRLLRGEPVLCGTKVPVRAVVEYWQLGVAIEEIPSQLPPYVTLQNVLEALLYYFEHREQIDDYIARNHIPPEWRGKRYNPVTGTVEPLP